MLLPDGVSGSGDVLLPVLFFSKDLDCFDGFFSSFLKRLFVNLQRKILRIQNKRLKNKIFLNFPRRRKIARARKEITSSSSLLRRRLDDCLLALSRLGFLPKKNLSFSLNFPPKKISTTFPPFQPGKSSSFRGTVSRGHSLTAAAAPIPQNGTRKNGSSSFCLFCSPVSSPTRRVCQMSPHTHEVCHRDSFELPLVLHHLTGMGDFARKTAHGTERNDGGVKFFGG